ncbi:CAAX prenyl protease [Kappamyces sp. JEL0680]|nr:CAAX prenyl protease [Kappamyces sp. JEL0680]
MAHGRNSGPFHNLYNHASPRTRALALGLRCLGLVGISQSLPKLQLPFELADSTSTAHPGRTPVSGSSAVSPLPASIKARCPMDFNYGKDAANDPDAIYGMKRITRHPQLFSLGTACLSVALTSPYLSHLVFWGFPIVFAVIGGAHQDSRHSRGLGGTLTETQKQQTSLIPFAALVRGKQSWTDVIQEFKGLNGLVAVVVACITML